MSDARLVDKILKRKEANRKNLAWPVSVADLKSWLQEEPSSFHRQTFLNFLYPSAPDWLLIVCDNLNEFIPYLPKPLTYQTFTNLHLWTIYQIRNEDWRHHFWQQVPNWFAEPLELLNFLRHIPAECMHDALRRPGMGACLAKLTPSMRYEWIVDLFSANPERLFSIEAIIALLTDQTLADQKNILERLKDSYLKVRPLSLARLSQFLNVLHPELFALFREEFDALFCVFNAKQFVSGTENVLNFLTLLDTPKHQAFFELFRGDEIQWWIAGLPFTAASISKEQKQSLIGALINASAKYNLVEIIQLRVRLVYVLQHANDPARLLNRLTDKELSELLLHRNESIADAVREIIALNLEEALNKLLMEAFKRIFKLQYGEKTSLLTKWATTFYKTQHELDTQALDIKLQPPTPSAKPSG